MSRKTGVIMSGFLMVFEILSTLLYTPYLISTLGQSEYGIYTLVLSATTYLTLLDLGVGNSIIRYVSKYRATGEYEEQRRFLGVATIYYGIIAAVVLALGFVLIAFFPSLFAKGLTVPEIAKAKQLMAITVLSIAVSFSSAPYRYVLTAYEKFFLSKSISIMQIVLRVGLSTLALYMGFGSLGIVSVTFVTTVILATFMVLYVRFKMKLLPTYKKIEARFIKNIAAYSSWILLQMIATQINQMADQVLIGMFAASSSVILGIYGVGAQINQYFQSVAGAFNGVLMPGIVRLVETDGSVNAVQREMERIGRIILMIVGLIWSVFLVFGQQFVILWARAENAKAYIVALLLMTPQVLILTQSVGSQVLWAKEKHKFQSILKFIIITLNVGFTIFLIKKWDALLGATVGTVISLVLGDILVMQIVYKKEIGLKLGAYYKNLLKGILPSLLITIAAGYAVKYLLPLNGWLGFILSCLIVIAVYGICMLSFGMNAYEKNLIFAPVKKILKKIHR